MMVNKNKIKVIYPSKKQEQKVEKIIRAVLAGANNGNLKLDYIQIVQELFDRGAEAIVLACTELPLVINYEAINSKIYNSADILAEKIIDFYYQP